MHINSVALIGLGAIGAVVAPKLQNALGNEHFFVVASGTRKERLQKGVRINNVLYHFSINEQAAADTVDLVIFAIKNTQLEAAIKDAAPVIDKHTIIISLLNGISSEDVIRQNFPDSHVLTSVIRIPSSSKGNVITYPEDRENISFGESRNDTYSEEVNAVKELFDKAGIRNKVPVDMVRDQWLKFMANVSENQVAAITGSRYAGFQTSIHLMELVTMVSKEVLSIAKGLHIDITADDLANQKDYIMHIPSEGKPSTLQDIEAGRKTEVEYFSGTIIRLGKELGIATPYNLFIYYAILGLEDLSR